MIGPYNESRDYGESFGGTMNKIGKMVADLWVIVYYDKINWILWWFIL